MVALARALRRRGVAVASVDPARGRLGLVAALARPAAARLVHVHICGHNSGSFMLLALARVTSPRSPVVVTLHSGILPDYLARLGPAARRALALLLASVDGIITVNRPNAEALAGLGLPAARIGVVPAFIAEDLQQAAALGRLGPAPERASAAGPRLAAMVAPEALYGADILVDGFTAIAASRPTATLALFGTGGADRAVAATLAQRGLGARVSALGELPRESVLALLRSSDVLVRPTRADGDSVCVREALALGSRVVASDVVARPAGTFVFPSEDAAALARAVAQAMQSPPAPPPTDDGLWGVLSVYRRLGWELGLTSTP